MIWSQIRGKGDVATEERGEMTGESKRGMELEREVPVLKARLRWFFKGVVISLVTEQMELV